DGVQVEEQVPEDERRARAVGRRRARPHDRITHRARDRAQVRAEALHPARAHPAAFVPAGTTFPSSTRTCPLASRDTASHGSAFGAGPFTTAPSSLNCEPWHGHAN